MRLTGVGRYVENETENEVDAIMCFSLTTKQLQSQNDYVATLIGPLIY